MTLVELQAFVTTLPGYSVFPPFVLRPVTLAPGPPVVTPPVAVAGYATRAANPSVTGYA